MTNRIDQHSTVRSTVHWHGKLTISSLNFSKNNWFMVDHSEDDLVILDGAGIHEETAFLKWNDSFELKQFYGFPEEDAWQKVEDDNGDFEMVEKSEYSDMWSIAFFSTVGVVLESWVVWWQLNLLMGVGGYDRGRVAEPRTVARFIFIFSAYFQNSTKLFSHLPFYIYHRWTARTPISWCHAVPVVNACINIPIPSDALDISKMPR